MTLVIKDVGVYEVLDSRGNPAVRTEAVLSDGSMGATIAPSGASTDSKEALEFYDNDERFGGKGALKAVSNVNGTIADKILGLDALDQAQLNDTLREFDGTNNYLELGANVTLGISMATAHAAANALGVSSYRYLGDTDASILSVLVCNITNGDAHASNNVDPREFMIMPFGFINFREALYSVCEIYAILKKEPTNLGYSTILSDEGDFTPNLANNTEPIDLSMTYIKRADCGNRARITLDVASTEFFREGKYHMEGKAFSSEDLIERCVGLYAKYPICSIEGDLAKNDFEGWIKLIEELDSRIQLVGDDLFVTNEDILREGIIKKMIDTMLIKLNQIGTTTQTMRTVRLAQRNNHKCVMSHRSGESEDILITDFAVALNTGQIKTGALARGERITKYNRLLEIELESDEHLGERL